MKRKPAKISMNLTKLSVAVALATSAAMVQAVEVDFGSRDIDATWNNTLKYSAAWRVKKLDEEVTTDWNPNLDSGDRNFDRGLISNRVDLLSEFDLRYKRNMGFRVSAAGWYDDVYHDSTDYNVTSNPLSVLPNVTGTPNDQFPSATKELHGGDIELLDAFVYGRTKLGGGNLSVKLGRFAQMYGESLFFGANGIANAQANPDIVKLLSVPGSQIKEILRPEEQIAVDYQIKSGVSVGAYYQLDWEPARIPGTGSYFAFADFPGAGGNLLLAPFGAADRDADIDASDSGQFGLQLKVRQDDTEYGLYATRHHDKFPQFYVRPPTSPNAPSTYALVYGEDIETYGASISTLLGETNVAAELSHRRNTPLHGVGNVILDPLGNGDGDKNALYPVGKTWHLNLSAITVFNESALWDGASFVGEFAYNYLASVDKNEDQLDPNATRSASAIRFTFQPEYFQVMSGVDLQVPISVGYGLDGRSSVLGAGAMPPEHGGDISVAFKADVDKLWQTSLGYTHYFGDAGGVVENSPGAPLSYAQLHKDRDFISFSVQRTF
jgi:hypothetical protein